MDNQSSDIFRKGSLGRAVTDLPEYKRYKPTAADYLDSAKKAEGKSASTPAGSAPKVGDTKTFPNGRKAKWDGKGWVAI
jgi:hypothetical protein